MKIVLIDKEENLKVGGITTYNSRLYHHLISHGHKVYILRFAKQTISGRNIYKIPYYLAEKRTMVILPSEKTLSIIKKHLINLKPDLVYTCVGISPFDFFLPSLCHELNIPITAVWHADYNENRNSYYLLVKSIFMAYAPFCLQLDHLHVFSDKLKNFYIRRGMPKKRIIVLPNGVDPTVYKPGKSDYGEKHRIKTGILFLGRLTIQKNPEALIKAFLSINTPRDTKLVIIGHGEQAEMLRENYKNPQVIFTGPIKDEREKLEIMRSCQIYVLPSRVEGMSLALLEAMSTGLSCIATDVGANGQLLGKAGILIAENKIKWELPLALKILLDNNEFARLLARQSRLKIIKEYSQAKIFNRLTEEFARTISDYKREGPPKTRKFNIEKLVLNRISPLWNKIQQIISDL
jgi:glycosyltransferase involved in cell wall biosynthesis